jgi:hypothetical protein
MGCTVPSSGYVQRKANGGMPNAMFSVGVQVHIRGRAPAVRACPSETSYFSLTVRRICDEEDGGGIGCA